MAHHTHDTDVSGYRFGSFESGRSTFVSGVFDEIRDAEKAVVALQNRGYGREAITVLMSDETRRRYLGKGTDVPEIEKGSKAAEGLGTGAAIGGTLGAIAGAIAAVGTSLVIPGLGLVVAGPLAAALAGAGAGGATGGLLGTLIGAGIPEYQAKHYEERVKSGDVVVGVEARSEDEADEIEDELEDLGAEDVKQSDSATAARRDRK
ncbi:MAG: hypothetical protein ABR599_12895 [Gemmatimonadota bacterium]